MSLQAWGCQIEDKEVCVGRSQEDFRPRVPYSGLWVACTVLLVQDEMWHNGHLQRGASNNDHEIQQTLLRCQKLFWVSNS